MPTNFVRNAKDECLWDKAKKLAEKQGQAKNYAYIMSIYQNMKKSFVVHPAFRAHVIPGQIPNLHIVRKAKTRAKEIKPLDAIEVPQPIFTANKVVSDMGFAVNTVSEWANFINQTAKSCRTILDFHKAMQQKMNLEKVDLIKQRIIMKKAIKYWERQQTLKSQTVAQDYKFYILEKAGPYIGPRGGKWADPKHTIPWDDKKAKKKAMQDKQLGLFDQPAKKPEVKKPPQKESTGLKDILGKISTNTLTTLDLQKPEIKQAFTQGYISLKDNKLVLSDKGKTLLSGETTKPKFVVKDTTKTSANVVNKESSKVKESTKKVMAQEVGEHVWGSRADLAVSTGSDLDKLTPDQQDKLVTKAKLLAPLNVSMLLDMGVQPTAIMLRKAVEKAIASKPGNSLEGRKNYMGGIDFISRSLDACRTTDDIFDLLFDWSNLAEGRKRIDTITNEEKEKLVDEYMLAHNIPIKANWQERAKALKIYKDAFQKAKQSRSDYHNKKITLDACNKIINTSNDLYRKYAKLRPDVQVLAVFRWKYNSPAVNSSVAISNNGDYIFYDHDSALQAFQGGGNKYKQYKQALGPNIEKLVNTGGTNYGYVNGKQIYPPKPFLDAYDATKKIKDLPMPEQLVEMDKFLETKQTTGPRRAPFNFERQVPGEIDRIGGQTVSDVTPQTFADMFGLRNVQFGKWVTEDEAKSHIMGAQGAFLDLADMIGVDPKTISLNGRLSLGIGSRGIGGKANAKAHYESSGQIINITKIAGGGSLAHEWAHAMDNIIVVASNPKSTKARLFLSNNDIENVNHAVTDAFTDVMNLITYGTEKLDPEMQELQDTYNKYKDSKEPLSYSIKRDIKKYKDYQKKGRIPTSKFVQDANAIGKTSYWSSPVELFARAFESYIEDKLHSQNRRSSYLVSGTRVDYDTNRGENNDAQPYPKGDERKAINKAMEKLMSVISTTKTLEKSLYLLEKSQSRGGKYFRRIPKKAGKGYNYFYNEDKYHSRSDAHANGADAQNSYIGNKLGALISNAGKAGCHISTFKSMVEKYGSKQVANALKSKVEKGECSYKKGRFFAKQNGKLNQKVK